MKNNRYINTQKYYRQQFESVVPAVYASIAMTLAEGNMEYETISQIFARSQEIWEEHKGDVNQMLIRCYNEVGIQLMTEKQYANAVKKGLIKEDNT